MNKGKICVSVCAGTADEMIANIKRAEEFADVVEVRFDCLSKQEVEALRPRSYPGPRNVVVESATKPVISTFRPKDQGGCRDLSYDERSSFWQSGHETEYCDVEEEFVDDSWAWLWGSRICSFHDFSGVPENIEGLFDQLAATDAEIIKIAAKANDITDAIPIWKLLEYSKSYKQISKPSVIPIAMGDAGKWTRILGLAHGAFLTYASLDAGKETADGQITAKDMRDVYRVKEINQDTKVFGVVGDPVSSSVSPYMHNPAFAAAGENAVFIPLQVKDLDEFVRRMVKGETREVELNFGGFSVTMPHKQAILRYLDAIDPVAEKIGAVNTVKIEGGKLIGFNTDAHGFITPLKARFGDVRGTRVAVFGAGGAARAVVFALKNEGANITVFVRDLARAMVFSDDMSVDIRQMSSPSVGTDKLKADGFEIVVNATPLGMKGVLENETLFSADELFGVKFVYDLVTKPTDTPLLAEAKKADVPAIGGIEMLIAQGAMQCNIWTGREAPVDLMRSSLLAKMNG